MKQIWKPGNMVYPVPAVLVSSSTPEGKDNLFTAAWTGTVCTNPAMAYISIRPERYSYGLIRESGEFVINLTTQQLTYATDFCGVRSGRDVDKFQKTGLHKEKASQVNTVLVEESPVNLECKVREIHEYGSHHMFVADILAVHADEEYLDEHGRFHLEKARPIAYSHGKYYVLGEQVGSFGYSVKKEKGRKFGR